MLKKLILLLFLTITSCGLQPRYSTQIDSVFQPYVSIFDGAALDRGIPTVAETTGVVIRWGKLLPNAAAICSYETVDGVLTPVITVDSVYWYLSYIHEVHREVLILHELGHCVLKRQHDDTAPYRNRNFKSIMYFQNSVTDYFDHKEDYLNELFGIEK